MVQMNRDFLAALGAPGWPIIKLQQVHSGTVLDIDDIFGSQRACRRRCCYYVDSRHHAGYFDGRLRPYFALLMPMGGLLGAPTPAGEARQHGLRKPPCCD